MSPTTYLITGAARGIGRALVEAYAQRPDSTVVAAVRDPNSEHSKTLKAIKLATGSKIIVVKIDSFKDTDAAEAVKELKFKGITSLDVVVANAGIASAYSYIHETKAKDITDHYQINVVGVVTLWAAVRPLLLEAAKTSKSVPRFITMGSSAGSIGVLKDFPLPNTAYGPSKAAVHWIATKINYETPEVISFPMMPGFLQTDMGNFGAVSLGIGEKAFTTVEEALPGILDVIDTATKERYAGELIDYTGKTCPW